MIDFEQLFNEKIIEADIDLTFDRDGEPVFSEYVPPHKLKRFAALMYDAGMASHQAPQPPAEASPLTDEELKHLLSKSDLLDMFRHIGWYSAPEKGFREHGATLIRAAEQLVLQKAGLK